VGVQWTGMQPPHVCVARDPSPPDEPTRSPDPTWSLARAERSKGRKYSVVDYPSYCEKPLMLVTPPPGVLLNRQWDGYSAAVGLAQALNRTLLLPGFWYDALNVGLSCLGCVRPGM
jgi:hypothetical protein